ncbi:MAG: hypothetical protein Q9211_003579 [Gyalolechia sp. 1 TL-2023]
MILPLWPLFLLTQLTRATNVEYQDGPSSLDHHAHIVQKCRALGSGDCCVPVDLIPPRSNRVPFRPSKVVFEYFSTDALYVFAAADDQAPCDGPSVDGYKDPAAQRYVKDFVARPHQRFSGALVAAGGEVVRAGRIRYPGSISYRNIVYYQVPADPLFYVDATRRFFLRATPQFGQ